MGCCWGPGVGGGGERSGQAVLERKRHVMNDWVSGCRNMGLTFSGLDI